MCASSSHAGWRFLVRYLGLALGLLGCVSLPVAGPLIGRPTTSPVPATRLAEFHQRVVFRWAYAEKIFRAHGEGVARLAAPDSARLDFFLENGASAGYVLLIGDSVDAPAADDVRRYIPSTTLLWAALGRLTAEGSDTVLAVDGDTLRVDIGRAPTWRSTFVDNRLIRVERIAGGRVEESIAALDSVRLVYRQLKNQRTLNLTVTRRIPEAAFDEAIWRR